MTESDDDGRTEIRRRRVIERSDSLDSEEDVPLAELKRKYRRRRDRLNDEQNDDEIDMEIGQLTYRSAQRKSLLCKETAV